MWLCSMPMTLGEPLSPWESRAPYLNVEIRVLTSRAVQRPRLAHRKDPPRGGGCSVPCPVSKGRGPPGQRPALCSWPLAPSLMALSGRKEGGATRAQCLQPQRCPRGLRDSWAARAEPAPPLRSAHPWQGAHWAPGLHLRRPEAGDARPMALTLLDSVVYRVLAPPTKLAPCPLWSLGTEGENRAQSRWGPEHPETCRKGDSPAWSLPHPPVLCTGPHTTRGRGAHRGPAGARPGPCCAI